MTGARRGSRNELALPVPDGDGSAGKHPIGHEQVSDIQRVRILAAMSEEVAGRGVGKVTVAHIVARSGVSRRTFYELFSRIVKRAFSRRSRKPSGKSLRLLDRRLSSEWLGAPGSEPH